MSYITIIKGDIEIRLMNAEREDLLENIRLFEGYSENFPRMFCIPLEFGTKGPDYILFSANINYCGVEKLVETFADFVGMVSEHVDVYYATLFHQTEDDPQMGIRWNRNLHSRILDSGVLNKWDRELRGLL